VWQPGGVVPNPLGITDIPYQPWAKALWEDRQENELEPHTRCKPSGVARQFLTPYGVEILELPELQRVFVFDIGGPQTYRTIYMDGRAHPADLDPTWYGHSIGKWENDVLVVDTVGFLPGALTGVTPNSDKLHVVERFTLDPATMALKREYTADDSLYLAAQYKGSDTLAPSNVPYAPEPCEDLTPTGSPAK